MQPYGNRFRPIPRLEPLRNPILIWARLDGNGPETPLLCDRAGDDTLTFPAPRRIDNDSRVMLRVMSGRQVVVLIGRVLEEPVPVPIGTGFRVTLGLQESSFDNLKAWRRVVDLHRLRAA